MANTINTMSPEEILRGLINGTLTELEDDDVTAVGDRKFSNMTSLTRVSLSNATTIGESAFRDCTHLTDINFPKVTSVLGNAFYNCTALGDVYMPNATTLDGAYMFYGACSGASGVFPKVTTLGQTFRMSSFNKIDLKAISSIGNYVFTNCSFKILILRKNNAITTLGNTGTFSATPFASGGTGGTLYVPQALISTYQSASNWSTILGYANNQIKSIEGSEYENYYADGTPIPTE